MDKKITFAEKILQFNETISKERFELPDGYKIINPFNGENEVAVKKLTTEFYHKFYEDNHIRRIIFGSTPSRSASAITGIPFEDYRYLQQEIGSSIKGVRINRSSSDFLMEVISAYGGRGQFYKNFYMNFVCPVGIIKISSTGRETNCNYYEDKRIQKAMYSFIIHTIKSQLTFGIDTTVCFCIGSGENYKFLSTINSIYKFFDTIIPLEHPRFIMQYNAKRKDEFLEKYIRLLSVDSLPNK